MLILLYIFLGLLIFDCLIAFRLYFWKENPFRSDELPFQTRSPIDRRRVKDRRLFLIQEYLDHNPERRNIMIRRRMLGDRRELLPIIA